MKVNFPLQEKKKPRKIRWGKNQVSNFEERQHSGDEIYQRSSIKLKNTSICRRHFYKI